MDRRWTRVVALALIALLAMLLAGCGLSAPGGMAPVAGQSCVGVPGQICARIRDRARTNAPPGAGNLVGIAIRCTAAICAEAQGEVSVTATYASGETTGWGESWASADASGGGGAGLATPGVIPEPSLPVDPQCIGIGLAWCRQMAIDALGSVPAGAAPAAIVVRCTRACSLTHGDGTTIVTLSDGTTSSVGWSYEGSPPSEP